MKYRPFLSHKRQSAAYVDVLKRELCIRGAGGWRDTDDLSTGTTFEAELVDAIENVTGGFILWATRDILDSQVICATEIPLALDRAENDSTYAFVPVFAELSPGDRAAFVAALGPRDADRLLGRNGVLRKGKQSLASLSRVAARDYVRQLIKALPDGPAELAITAFRVPTGKHDLSLDWRTLFDAESRALADGGLKTLREALGDLRDAFLAREMSPRISVELALPMPLAMLVGHELRQTTQLQVTVKTVIPGDGGLLVLEPRPPVARPWAPQRSKALDSTGPIVVAVSVIRDLGMTVDRYAAAQGASAFEHLHVPENDGGAPLSPEDVRAVAETVVTRLRELQADGAEKHLLIAGPASLAAAIGLAGNAIGATWVPFYDGDSGYEGGILIGG